MEQSDLLRFVVGVLDRHKIRYFVTGSVAGMFYGEPRLTNDIDIVVQPFQNQIRGFCDSFPEGEYYLSEEAVREAITARGQFNIIHPASGLKVDVIVAADTPFNESRFSRSVRIKPGPEFEAVFAAVEDVIVKKLEAYKTGESEKHLRDIASMLKISGESVDRSYITSWAVRLGLESLWNAIESGGRPA